MYVVTGYVKIKFTTQERYLLFMPLFKEGGAYCVVHVGRYISRSVGRYIGRYVGMSVSLNLVQLITQEHFVLEASNLVHR